ncbi:MAG: hypothetical protein ACI4JS_08845 [Oscillospiraceae bacterium]
MAGDKYNVDDILKEVGKRRSKETDDDDFLASPKTGRSKPNSGMGSVTEILNNADLGRTGIQKKKEQPKTARQSPKMSVTQILNSEELNRDLKKGSSARQMTDEESEQRLARDISRAADERRRRMYEIEDEEPTNPTAENDDYIKLFVSQQKQENSDSDDDIVFHEVGDLVTTDTMQIRKQKKIDDINEALLRIDSEANSPDDMLDSINPMESREKAVEIVKSGESTNEFELNRDGTDTFSVSNDELKRMSHRDEHVREYTPSGAAPSIDDDIDDTPYEGIRSAAVSAEIHLGDTIIEALNKKIAEEENVPKTEAARSVEEPEQPLSEAPAEETNDADDQIDNIRRVDELARKKKLKIANFILENHDTEEIPAAEEKTNEYVEEDEDEPIDLDDENVIKDRLNRASKGLISRLLILAGLLGVTLFVAIVNALGIDGNLGFLTNIVSRSGFTDNYMYTHLVIGILSFSACSSVISNGLSRLIKLRPDGDTLCALAHITALASTVAYIFGNYYVVKGYCEVYLAVSLAALVCNTLSKLFTVNTAKRNFNFVFGGRTKYFIDRCSKENEAQLAKGIISGVPNIGAMRKTEVLYDFIVSTYCEDASDRMSRKIVPGVIAAGLVGGVVTFLTHTTTDAGNAVTVIDRVCWALTVLSAVFALGASFSSSMTVTLPMYLAARKNKERGSAILGYNAATQLAELNGVLVEARTLFPADSVRITNICGYEKPKTSGEGKVSIDDAIIYATSLAVASDSIMADSFFGMLNRKRELLKEVSGCVYESNLGVMGWIDRQRVLLGNRQHMKSHEITVPKLEKETAANTDNDEVIYLAVGGQVCLLFFVRLSPNPVIKQNVQALCDKGVSLIIKTVDGMITDAEISEQFDIEANKVKILPFEAHETFSDSTRFVPRGKAAVSCSGTFTSFANAIRTAHSLRSKAFICNIIQLCGVTLGIILALIFGLFAQFSMFDVLIIMLYNTIFGAAALAAQFLKNK